MDGCNREQGRHQWCQNRRTVSTFRIGLLLAAACAARGSDAVAPERLNYTILSNGQRCGSEVDVYTAGGRVNSTYEFNDRGRGPKISAHYLLGSNGWPLRTDVTGFDYLKAP